MSFLLLYEINTRCWLRELSAGGKTVSLKNIPESQFEFWRECGFTHIWLMGVWTSGPRSAKQALIATGQRSAYVEALSDFKEEDAAASPYSISAYKVPELLGGEEGLARFRARLNAYGIKLVLDFVPNHVGLDHAWLHERPELFVQSSERRPETFAQETNAGLKWLAHGKDPNFGPWTDTVQVDHRRRETRASMAELLESVARRCDGVRCDMAMLLLSEVFRKTWSAFPPAEELSEREQNLPLPSEGRGNEGEGSVTSREGDWKSHQPSPPEQEREKSDSPGGFAAREGDEFWAEVIPWIKGMHPGFVFLAEVYWGLEERLQKLGFDFTYDKELYDRLVAHDAAGVQRHVLRTATETLVRGAHFLENHDERRIASILTPEQHRAAALTILGLPGMRFLHEGQLTGARRRLPVQLARRQVEPTQPEVESMYQLLLAKLKSSAVGRGQFQLIKPAAAWVENPTAENFILVQWLTEPVSFDLVAVNLAAHPSQCYVPLRFEGLGSRDWAIANVLGEERYQRSGLELEQKGLYLDLPANEAQLLHFEPAGA